MKEIVFIFLRNIKIYKKYFIILISIFLFIFLILTIDSYYKYSYNKEVVNNLNNRIVKVNVFNVIDKNKIFNDLKNDKTVNLIYKDFPYINDKNTNLSYINDENLNIIYGKKINDLNINEIIISQNLKSKYKINNNYTFEYNKKIYNFKVVGYYKTDSNNIYANLETILNILNDNNLEFSSNYLILILNSYTDSVKMINKLNQDNIDANFIDYTGLQNMKEYKKILNTMKYILFIILVIIFVILYLIINSIMDFEKKDIGYMLISGYLRKDIFKILFLKTIIILILTYFISFIIVNLIIFILRSCFVINIINISFYNTLLLFLIITIFDIINILVLCHKINVRNVIKLISY